MEILKFIIYVLPNYSVAITALLYLVWLMSTVGVVAILRILNYVSSSNWIKNRQRNIPDVSLTGGACQTRTWETARQARLQKLQSKGKPAVEQINTRHFPVSSVTRNKGLGRQPSVSPPTGVTSEFPPLATPRGRSGAWSQSFGLKS